MASIRFVSALLVSGALLAPSAFASRVHQAPTSGQHHTSHKSSTKATGKAGATKAHGKRVHGQQAIDPTRAASIQEALIREHYLTGDASGKWDATTIAAMQKFQADQGWQTKLMPDSRALKKLGLGPDYSKAINAQGAAFSDPAQKGTTSPEQSSAFAEAAGVHQ